MRYRLLFVCSFLVATFGVVAGRAQTADFNVQANGMTSYTINAAQNPTLTLTRGHTYLFAVAAPGHPFFIKTAQVTGTGSAFNDGVTNNGIASGTLTFQVPSTAPSNLFYQCSIHSSMTGSIAIANPVPATNPLTTTLLGIVAIAAGIVLFRRRVQA